MIEGGISTMMGLVGGRLRVSYCMLIRDGVDGCRQYLG
jgi:hypothetical protein